MHLERFARMAAFGYSIANNQRLHYFAAFSGERRSFNLYWHAPCFNGSIPSLVCFTAYLPKTAGSSKTVFSSKGIWNDYRNAKQDGRQDPNVQ
jgi:hypothetical protein